MKSTGLLDLVAGFGERALEATVRKYFPGMTSDALAQGWIPIPQAAIEAGLRRAVKGVPEVETVRLSCVPSAFVVELDTKAYWVVKSRLSASLELREFTLTKRRKLAELVCDGDVAVEGRNLVGRLAAGIVQSMVETALQGPDTKSRVAANTDELVELAWPRIRIHLSKLEELRRLSETQVLGKGLFDFVEFGPATIEQDHVRLKVGTAR